jgi:hypothetical protein
MTVKPPLVFAVVTFSATALAQTAPPTVGNKPLVQVKPKSVMGCKQVGAVQGTKLWAGNCVAAEPVGAAEENSTGAAPSLRH